MHMITTTMIFMILGASIVMVSHTHYYIYVFLNIFMKPFPSIC